MDQTFDMIQAFLLEIHLSTSDLEKMFCWILTNVTFSNKIIISEVFLKVKFPSKKLLLQTKSSSCLCQAISKKTKTIAVTS
jgi:hypothetical protein